MHLVTNKPKEATILIKSLIITHIREIRVENVRVINYLNVTNATSVSINSLKWPNSSSCNEVWQFCRRRTNLSKMKSRERFKRLDASSWKLRWSDSIRSQLSNWKWTSCNAKRNATTLLINLLIKRTMVNGRLITGCRLIGKKTDRRSKEHISRRQSTCRSDHRRECNVVIHSVRIS